MDTSCSRGIINISAQMSKSSINTAWISIWHFKSNEEKWQPSGLRLTASDLGLPRHGTPPLIQTISIYKANLTGPFNCEVKAFGNYDLKSVVWEEDKDELDQAQKAIDNMINHYHRSQFQRGPTYSLEYYRDSSINAVAYILYK